MLAVKHICLETGRTETGPPPYLVFDFPIESNPPGGRGNCRDGVRLRANLSHSETLDSMIAWDGSGGRSTGMRSKVETRSWMLGLDKRTESFWVGEVGYILGVTYGLMGDLWVDL